MLHYVKLVLDGARLTRHYTCCGTLAHRVNMLIANLRHNTRWCWALDAVSLWHFAVPMHTIAQT